MDATDAPAQTRVSIPLEPELNRKLYMPIILEKALLSVCGGAQPARSDSPTLGEEAIHNPEQGFRSLVNKLAQVCDIRPRGKTITALAVINGADGPECILGSNDRNPTELDETRAFLLDLLGYVWDNIDNMKERASQRKAVLKKVLWKILLFNVPRVEKYLFDLKAKLDLCIKDCERLKTQGLIDVKEFQEFRSELKNLRSRTEFEQNTMDPNKKEKFLSDCETLIKAIVAINNRPIDKEIIKRAEAGDAANSGSWRELQHYRGRMLAFRSAAESIINATEFWPDLFNNPKVLFVPSSTKAPRPFDKKQRESMTAAGIIQAMEEDYEPHLWHAEELQKFGLDGMIQEQASKPLRPLVHAEILVHDYLLSLDITHPRDYWGGYKYIGTSKPTCRLCSYYFLEHPVDAIVVRPSHSNVYSAWRLPDVYQAMDEQEGGTTDAEAQRQRRQLAEAITARMWSDARKTMSERLGRRKGHDSNTYSGVHTFLQDKGDYDDDGRSSTDGSGWVSQSSETRGTSPDEDFVGGDVGAGGRGGLFTNNNDGAAESSDDEDDGGVFLGPAYDLGIY